MQILLLDIEGEILILKRWMFIKINLVVQNGKGISGGMLQN